MYEFQPTATKYSKAAATQHYLQTLLQASAPAPLQADVVQRDVLHQAVLSQNW